MSDEVKVPKRFFLITGSDEICEVVEQAELMKAVHDMFCCCDADACDNCYFEAFKEEWRNGAEFEGWHESLEDGWLNVEELPAEPRQMTKTAERIAQQDAERERVIEERRLALNKVAGLEATVETLSQELFDANIAWSDECTAVETLKNLLREWRHLPQYRKPSQYDNLCRRTDQQLQPKGEQG